MSALPGRDGMRSRDRCDVTPPPPRPCPTSHAPHSDADEHWYAAAETSVVSYSACWLSPFPPYTILHFIHEPHKPVLLMAFVVFFRRPFGAWVGLLGRGEGSGRHWEGKGITTAVGNVFIGNYKN